METLAYLTSVYAQKSGIMLNQVRLTTGGEHIEDSRTLNSYCLTSDSIVHVIHRMRHRPRTRVDTSFIEFIRRVRISEEKLQTDTVDLVQQIDTEDSVQIDTDDYL